MTVANAVEIYLSDLSVAGRAKGTLELYRYLLKALAKAMGPRRTLASIRREDMVRFLAAFKQRGSAQSYINLVAHVTKSFWAWSMRQGYVCSNPMAGMILPRDHPQPRRPFSKNEVARLIAVANTPLAHAILLILLDTGIRASELAGLQLGDVDFESNTLTIHGKGDKTRFVALNPRPREALVAYLVSRPQHDGTIWPERFNRKTLAYLLDGVGRQAQVAPIFPHRFRNTFACAFLASTGNPLALQAILGHSSLSMTARYVAVAQAGMALEVHRQHPLT